MCAKVCHARLNVEKYEEKRRTPKKQGDTIGKGKFLFVSAIPKASCRAKTE